MCSSFTATTISACLALLPWERLRKFDPNVKDKTAGAIEFKLAATAAQRALVRVTLFDAGNRASPPAEFAFTALAVGGRTGADYGEAPDELPANYAGPFADVIGHFPTLFKTTNSRIAGTPGAHALEVPLESPSRWARA